MKKEGGCEWYHSIGLLILYISADLKKICKGPRPFKQQKNVFERLNNFSCVLTGSCGYRRRKFDTVVYFSAIDSIAGDVPPLSCF